MSDGKPTGSREGVIVLFILNMCFMCNGQVLTPPTFNLAKGRDITATATCGIGISKPELYCQLTGVVDETDEVNSRSKSGKEIIQGQLCDYCDLSDPEKTHDITFATDGTERYWQSPPLSRGDEFNKVDIQIDFEQEFHIAYVIIKMGNSPRPGVWALEKSVDFGETWQPWQYFADTPVDCKKFFDTEVNSFPSADDQVICTTDFSRIVPLFDGEIFVSLVNGRPSANNFSYADELKEFMKATNVRIRLLRTRTLLGHLMAVQNQDPTVTRRYYYSIKDISFGGRCVCNGHADTCNYLDPTQPNKLICDCQHNTIGDQCQMCDAANGFVQKKWQPARANIPFECEPCQCYNRANECVYDPEVDEAGLSIDIHGFYRGGGVCQNCRYSSTGTNCEKCLPGYFRPRGVPVTQLDMCQPCQCDLKFHINECEEETGQCLCREEFTGYNCDRCALGYYDYPECKPCDCHVNGTMGELCEVGGGQCPCKENYVGINCDMCQKGYYNFPACQPCECDRIGARNDFCNVDNGQCECSINYGSRNCSECANGFFNFPDCDLCDCEAAGSVEEVCDKSSGQCLCKEIFNGDRCDVCARGYYAYPDCMPCLCQEPGSTSNICQDRTGQCQCRPNYAGQNCDRCAAGFYRYPDCVRCECDPYGSYGETCDQKTGQCDCKYNFQGLMCEKCKEGLYNYPNCEVCNCNPNGAKEVPGYPLGGCGEVMIGQLCECKERVSGRICDTCLPGYWNLNRNNPLGCEECGCYDAGTIAGLSVCDQVTGQCQCKMSVTGRTCERCRDGYYNLQKDNFFGCQECNCDIGGSESPYCDRETGQCPCKPRVEGHKCDQPIQQHFIPTLDQMKFEIEDGYTPEGARVRYGYDERLFPEFSWRGYAILIPYQPEVRLDFDISKSTLYRLVYRFVNLNDNAVKGEVTLRPDAIQEITQSGEIVFAPSTDPAFADVGNKGGPTTFVLNPGQWTVMIKANDSIFLDYMFLIPQAYYEATVLQNTVYRPCLLPSDQGPCYHYSYPDVLDFPRVLGENAYTIINGTKTPVDLFANQDTLDELNIKSMADLDPDQKMFDLDLYIPKDDRYVLILNYYSEANGTQNILLTINNQTDAIGIINYCKFSSLCRQVLLGMDEMVGVFDLEEGFNKIRITGDDDVQAAIESVVAIPYSVWSVGYVRPSIVCIRINGVCIRSRYSSPVGSVRIEFESLPNDHLIADVYPPDVDDSDISLVRLNDTLNMIVLLGTARSPGQHKFLVHYYLPTESGQDISVTLFANGKEYKGTFRPYYCPNVHGCREMIYFENGMPHTNVDLQDTDVKIVFNNTSRQEIWLDYMLLIPSGQYSPTDVMVAPVDNSRNFIETCLDDGYKIKTPITEFCEKSLFSLTTEFNNGALNCECDIDGSHDLQCDPYGGQCQCRANVIGRTCSACREGYYGFPRCQPCNCPFGLCEQVTGKCICPPRVTGDRCDICLPGTYGYDALIGCQDCECNIQGVVDRDTNCEANTGQCNCMEGIGGRKCEYCLAGFWAFPQCRECDCDRYGTTDAICDPTTSYCMCKENVEGPRCGSCRAFTYNLEAGNPEGCTSCFCFGNTANCRGSYLKWDSHMDMNDWEITNTVDGDVRDAGTVIAVLDALDKIVSTNTSMYWVAPESYLGNRVTSYGGYLHYRVLFMLPRNDSIMAEAIMQPDIILVGNNNMTIVHTSLAQPYDSADTPMEVQLYEYNFMYKNSMEKVSREDFMMILVDLQALHIRASYYSLVREVRLSDVELDIAVRNGTGPEALSVEDCACPRGYVGTSCEDCAPGYYRARHYPFLGVCVPCDCNRHAATCDLNTGECINCANNTMGAHCEMCRPGYYGNPYVEGCNICGCPSPVESNNFADSCSVTVDGFVASCNCFEGYTGDRCERCAPGYYGNPYSIGDTCELCQCNNNLNMRDPEACDFQTGQCLHCINNSTGPYCERCRDWFYGDAVVAKDCHPCSCNQCGSLACDSDIGVCACKPNVIGLNCDSCAPDYYGFDGCNGCSSCNCGEGSVTSQCDDRDGSCTCQPGVTGFKCDACIDGFWNYNRAGCDKCNCEFDGAVTCDPVDGRCQCLPGVTGVTCDQCLDRWVLIPQQGCQECDTCIDNLLDDIEGQDAEMSGVQESLQTVSIGVAAMRRLEDANMTVIDFTPKLYSVLYESENISLDPVANEIAEVRKQINDITSLTEGGIQDAEELINSAIMLEEESREATKLGDMSNKEATEAVQYVNDILRQMNEGIQVINIETYITMSEQIMEQMRARNFSEQNDTLAEGIMEADMKLAEVKQQMMAPEAQMEELRQTDEVLDDIDRRLKDLESHSESSQATSAQALNLIDNLRDETMMNIQVDVEEINFAEKLIDANLESSRDLLNTSASNMDTATEAMEEVGARLSMLKNGVEILNQHKSRFSRLTEVAEFVNSTEEHATYLQEQATVVENMYTDTREISANAVMAGQAYNNIVDAIEDANEASLKSYEAADIAVVDSFGVEDKAFNNTKSSMMLLKEAEMRHNTTKTDLLRRLSNAQEGTVFADEKNKDAAMKIQEVKNKIQAADNNVVEDRATALTIKGEETSQKAEDAQSKVKVILDELPQKVDMTIPLADDSSNTRKDITTTRSQVRSVQTIVPNIRDLLNTLTEDSEKIMNLGQTVKTNIAALKEKIAIARNQANLIRVGLDFLGNTSVELRKPRSVSDAGSYSQVSLYFRTRSENGLLLYIGSDQSGSNFANRDYMALQIENGQVVFKYDLNPAMANSKVTINHPHYVADGQWYKVTAKRIGKAGTLTIERDPSQGPLDSVNGMAKGSSTVLDLHPITTKFYAGGLPDGVSIASTVTRSKFRGAIEGIHFDDEPMGVWNFEDGQNNYKGARERNVLSTAQSSNGYRFDGTGYVVLDTTYTGWKPAVNSQVSMKFKTYAEEGLLFFAGEGRDFLSIELRDGKLIYRFDLGGGAVKIASNKKVNDGEWHYVQVNRRERTGVMYVDEELCCTADSPGTLTQLSISDDIFVGGYRDIILPVSDVTKVGFIGCIEDLALQVIIWDMNDNKQSKGVIPGCPDQIARVATFSTSDVSYIANPLESIGRDFDLTFKMKTKQKKALLFYASNDDQTAGLSLSLVDGKLSLISDPGDEKLSIMSRVNNYNDGHWHYISVMKKGRELEMNIDDVETARTNGQTGSASLETTIPLYFGNADVDIPENIVSVNNQFKGCIGDLTINGEFVNFAILRDSQRPNIALAGCPIPDPETIYNRDPLPTLYPPTTTIATTEPPTPPPGKCALDVVSVGEITVEEQRGYNFGAFPNSRVEYGSLPKSLRIRAVITLDFRTTEPDGVIFYFSDTKHVDHISITLTGGMVRFTFNSGTGIGVLMNEEPVNDGEWHTLSVARNFRQGVMMLDDVEIGITESPGRARSINGAKPFYIGGLDTSTELPNAALKNLGGVTSSFRGCIANLQVDKLPAGEPVNQFGVLPCSGTREDGAYFYGDGGYIQLVDTFKVGLDLKIEIELRPRSLNGVIFSIHSDKQDFVVLQLVKGELWFTADNGGGSITSKYIPKMNNELCDGGWHSITAVKNKNIVMLTVDNEDTITTTSANSATSADTNNPIYLGGKPDSITKGIRAKGKYRGCMRGLVVNDETQYMATGTLLSDVRIDGCPTE